MMYRRIMLACSVRLAWPVPSSVKYRNAVNCASTRFNQDEFAGVQAISTLARLRSDADPGVLVRTQVRAEIVADDRDPGRGRVEGAQVAAEFQESGPRSSVA